MLGITESVVNDASHRIRTHVQSGDHAQAYAVGKAALRDMPDNPAVLSALFELTATLRSECMDMASRRMDASTSYAATEALLREVNELTGQDMYGRPQG
ncbi:MAG: hypothetical protein ABS955_05430 [Stenotrophomonas maltophilia]